MREDHYPRGCWSDSRINLIATTGAEELADFKARTFKQWDRASLVAVRRSIDARRRELAS